MLRPRALALFAATLLFVAACGGEDPAPTPTLDTGPGPGADADAAGGDADASPPDGDAGADSTDAGDSANDTADSADAPDPIDPGPELPGDAADAEPEAEACVPLTCEDVGATCGEPEDGCGGTLECGECVAPETCGGGGLEWACGCTPQDVCEEVGHACGEFDDGCGNPVDCGACDEGSTCIAGAPAYICCQLDTCEGAGAQCGTLSDNCGGTLDCGGCDEGDVCYQQVELDPGSCCTPLTCEEIVDVVCGPADDGCGGTVDCGGCEDPENGLATCSEGACTIACNGGFHPCGDTCADNADPLTCGTSCDPCPIPDGAVATCDGGTCGFVCEEGLEYCPSVDACVDFDNDNDHCGECDNVCPNGCAEADCLPLYALVIESGNGQAPLVNQAVPMPVVVALTDNGVAAPNVEVVFDPAPGAAVVPPIANTDGQGKVLATARVGREPAVYGYTATVVGTDPPVSAEFLATASAPPEGTIFSVVNVDLTQGPLGIPGAGSLARLGDAYGLVVASDGTLYVSDASSNGHKVRRVTPAGFIEDVAGADGKADFTGDLGPATLAKLNTPSGLALDEPAQRLYVADRNNDRVRLVDLATDTISTFAGGADELVAPPPNYGDGNSATFANLDGPSHLAVGPNGDLYIADSGHNRIRKVSKASTVISTVVTGVPNGTPCPEDDSPLFVGCNGGGCALAWDEDGNLFVSGRVACGASDVTSINNAVHGILRLEPDGSLHHVAGRLDGSTGDGVPAGAAALGAIEGLAFDAVGNLYLSEPHRVRRIDGATGRLSTLAGTVVAGASGNYGLSEEAQLNTPWELGVGPNHHIYIADRENGAIRAIWAGGDTVPPKATLEAALGVTQIVAPVQTGVTPIGARVLDADGVGVPGVTVNFESLSEGAALPQKDAAAAGDGIAAVVARAGLAIGDYLFQAWFTDIHGFEVEGSPADFVLTVAPPEDNTLLTVVNVDHTLGQLGVPGPAATARVARPIGIAAASDGVVYFSDYSASNPRQNMVRRVLPTGVIENLAGSYGQGDFSGDLGPATDAKLNLPYGLALDEAAGKLYVADRNNDRVRVVFLATGVIDTVAGGGGATEAPYGDGNTPTSATFDEPTHLTLDDTGRLYIADSKRALIRRVDTVSQLTETFVQGTTTTPTCDADLVLRSCTPGCAMDFAAGYVYLLGAFSCGTTNAAGNQPVGALVRLDPTTGALEHLAGVSGGNAGDDVPAMSAELPRSEGIVVDGSGNVWFTDAHRIRVLSASTMMVTTVSGGLTLGFGGDYGPAIGGLFEAPKDLELSVEGHLLIADYENHALRLIWNASAP